MSDAFKRINNTSATGTIMPNCAGIQPSAKCVHLYPLANIYANDREYVIILTVSGAEPKNIHCRTEAQLLVVSCKTNTPQNISWIEHEFDPGNFCREFVVPAAYECMHVTSSYANGILTVCIPKCA